MTYYRFFIIWRETTRPMIQWDGNYMTHDPLTYINKSLTNTVTQYIEANKKRVNKPPRKKHVASSSNWIIRESEGFWSLSGGVVFGGDAAFPWQRRWLTNGRRRPCGVSNMCVPTAKSILKELHLTEVDTSNIWRRKRFYVPIIS